jgi:hypothetical protein
MVSRHVDISGKPFGECVLVLWPASNPPWNIDRPLWPAVRQAADLLALAMFSGQRFFEPHRFHINSTPFRPVFQGFDRQKHDGNFSLHVRRRDGPLIMGGLEFQKTIWQQPPETVGLARSLPSAPFAQALDRARRANGALWNSLNGSIPFFLLANTDDQQMPDETAVLLSAMAIEKLLVSDQRSGALVVAEKFGDLWHPFGRLTLSKTDKIRRDPNPCHAVEQNGWFVHKKWAKELYEARSSVAHRGPDARRSANWEPWQHVVLSAFTYPLLVKILLEKERHYGPTDEDIGACEALDQLLVEGFERESQYRPRWPEILSEHENNKALRRTIEQSFASSRGEGI